MYALKSLLAALVMLMAPALPADADDFYIAVRSEDTGEPTETEALVCFVRPAGVGRAIRFWAFVDETPIGVTKGKQFTCGLVPPGDRIFWTRAENIAALRLDVVAGETYMIKQAVRVGGMKARVRLEVLAADEGMEAVWDCRKRTELTHSGKTRAAQIAAEKWKTAQEKADSDQGGARTER